MRTTPIQRAELLKAVRAEAKGSGIELLREVFMDLDDAEGLVKEFVDTFGPNDSGCIEEGEPPCLMCRAEQYLEKP